MQLITILKADYATEADYDSAVQQYFLESWKPREPLIVEGQDMGIVLFNPFL